MEHFQQTFQLKVPSDTQNLSMIRDFVERTARRSALPSPDLEKLKLAVDEACANVIEHAHAKDATKGILVRVAIDEAQVVVEVIDSGPRYDPTQHVPLSIDEIAKLQKDGGMGIRLMKMATDELVSDIDEEGRNRLRLVKRIPPAGGRVEG